MRIFLFSCVGAVFEQVLNGFYENGTLVQSREGRPGSRTALGVLKFHLSDHSLSYSPTFGKLIYCIVIVFSGAI